MVSQMITVNLLHKNDAVSKNRQSQIDFLKENKNPGNVSSQLDIFHVLFVTHIQYI